MRQLWRRWRWKRLQQQTHAHAALARFFSHPWPSGRALGRDTAMLAVDLETTGLDPRLDAIVSVGWVALEQGRVVLASARRHVVHASYPLSGPSVVVHGLSHDQVAAGRPLVDVMSELLTALSGRVLVAHHAQLDTAFLRAACRSLWEAAIVFPAVDTLTLLERQHRRRAQPVTAHAFTLASARLRYNLPLYPAHDALWDAVGVAELWLALHAELAGGDESLPLARVLQQL